LIDERDILRFCLKKLKNQKEAVETAVYMREPWTVHFYKEGIGGKKFVVNTMLGSRLAIPGLIGEIFLEEERELSKVYEGILRCISNGKNKPSEIANTLFSRKLIAKNSPTTVQQYLVNLSRIGLVERLKVFGKKGSLYKHISSVFELYFYLDEKYNFSEKILNRKFVEKVLEQLLPKQVEDFFRNLLSKVYGLDKAVWVTRDYDIDIVLLRFKKPLVFAEVKKVDELFSKLKGKKFLIVPHEDVLEVEPKNLAILTPRDTLKLKYTCAGEGI